MLEMMSVGLRPEDLGGDDRQDGPDAGAQVLGGGLELDRAVGVDRAGDLLVLGAAAAPLVQGHAQAGADRAVAVLAARLALLAPADQLGPDLELALVDRRVEVAGAQVLEPELERVDAQLVGQVVHGGFHQGAALGMARGPHGPGAAGVDEDLGVGPRRGGDVVDIRKREVRAAPAAAGPVGLGDQGDDLAVLARPELDLARGARAVAAGQVLLDAVEEQRDRPAASSWPARRRCGPRRRPRTWSRSRPPCSR